MCQVVAMYLITGPNSSALGIYYVPFPRLCHETGISAQGGFEGPSEPL